ncbi:glycosyltransferase [Pseudodesulfovibrio sp. zrk46]|nr:glycosyltransferase [Pseudodesulfovibrio sp. zrk46]
MSNASRLTQQIITLVRNSGYLAPDHAMAVAGNILEAQPLPDAFAHLAPALIRHAAIFDPFDREKIRLAEDVNSRIAHQPFTEWLQVAKRLVEQEPVPELIPFPNNETAQASEYVEYMRQQSANDNRLPVLLHLWQTGARDELLEGIRIMAASPAGLLAGPTMAWGAYSAGENELAQMLLDESVTNFLSHNLRARFAMDAGDTDAAREHLHASLEAEPFQPAIIEQLAALHEADNTTPPGQDTHICLYTWNKPELLTNTLASLAATNIGDAHITVLNNGTTVCTADELEDLVRKRVPDLPIHWIHLPINIGAPAARNWLLALPEVRAARYVAFLDDDVLLPTDWLTRYINTLSAHPEAAAVGPKCVNQGVRTIQYAFRGFDEIGESKIRFTANAPTLMDMGQFNGRRPCLTVMGCCHLFHMERMSSLNVPAFDIRFSPSQVDDIEHDLQVWKAGGQVVYDGGVEVIHLQDTGKAKSRAALGQAYANHYKMEAKFDLAELEQMAQAVKKADHTHFVSSFKSIRSSIYGAARVFWDTMGIHSQQLQKPF